MAKILVTPRSLGDHGHPALAPLRHAGHEILIPTPGQTPSADTLKAVLPGCVGWLAGVEKITADILGHADCLRIISRNGVGVDNVDHDAAKAKGIEIATTPGANARGVAELALGLIFAVARGIPAADASIKAGGWHRSQGIELEGRTLGVIGFGKVGGTLARLAGGMGMNVICYDLFPNRSALFAGCCLADLDQLITESDVISLHIPAGERPLVDRAFLARTRKNLILVNTARAAAVDDAAIIESLDAGHLFGYGVDAFDPEPPGITPLTRHPRVVCTSHVGGYTGESVMRSAIMASESIVKKLRG